MIGCDAGAASDPALSAAAERLSEAGVEVHLDASGDAIAALDDARALIKSPGVPASAPIVAAARARGIPVLGEVELAWRLLENEFVAVTGTNGKTTTTEWIGHIHREAGLPVEVAGNVGTAAASLIGTTPAEATIVCEVSSFQLEDTLAFAPEVAVLLNLAPDHLDRHDSYDGYVAAKLRIFANQGPADVAVAPDGADDSPSRLTRQRVRFGDGLDADLSSTTATCVARRAAHLERGDLAARRAQSRQRDGRGGRLPRARDRAARRSLEGSGHSPASRTGSS